MSNLYAKNASEYRREKLVAAYSATYKLLQLIWLLEIKNRVGSDFKMYEYIGRQIR